MILGRDPGDRLRLRLQGGAVTEESFDAVVAADGIDSRLRAHVLQSDTPVSQKQSLARPPTGDLV